MHDAVDAGLCTQCEKDILRIVSLQFPAYKVKNDFPSAIPVGSRSEPDRPALQSAESTPHFQLYDGHDSHEREELRNYAEYRLTRQRAPEPTLQDTSL